MFVPATSESLVRVMMVAVEGREHGVHKQVEKRYCERLVVAQRVAAIANSWGAMLCAQELVDRGANVNYASRLRRETALMRAARHGQSEFVDFLLRLAATDVWLRDRDGKTALEYASEVNCHAAQTLLASAMNGGQRTRVFASVSALYQVCQWGCGFVAAAYDYQKDEKGGVEQLHPLAHHESEKCPKRIVACPPGCDVAVLWAEAVDHHMRRERARRRVTCPQRLVACPNECVDATSGEVMHVQAWALRQHDRSECLHRRVRCRNGCSATALLAKDRELHETQLCTVRRVACKWQCGETSVLAHAQIHHETDECLCRQLACPLKCHACVAFLDLETHTTTQCAHRNIMCSLGCGRKVPLHTMERHVTSECRRRIVACPHQCGATMEDGEITSHVTSQCVQRLTACALCGVDGIAQMQLATHRETACRMRVVQCRFQCYSAQPLLAHAQSHHEQFECSLRPVYCPLGCGETLIAHTAKRHEKVCDMRIVGCTRGCGAELREKDRIDHELRYCANGKMGTLVRGKL